MLPAFAPRMPRGASWGWSAIAAVALMGPVPLAFAQVPAQPKADTSKAAAKPEAAKPEVEKSEPPSDEGPAAEVFLDPNAKKALAKIEPLTVSGPAMKIGSGDKDASTIQNMAVGSIAIDPNFLRRYVDFCAVELSKRDNINAIISPPPNMSPAAARGMERAVDALTDPMLRARANDKKDFLTAYNKVLFDSSLVKLLENNLFSRIDAMIVLGMSGSTAPNALDLYVVQIKKPEQVIWVKMWAAQGLTNATRQGKDNLDASKTNQAAEALIALLDSDPKLPYPVQMRALEALGSLRLAWNNARGKIDAASVAMRFLADPEAKPEVRAWAAWALGMMRVPGQVTPYNFELLGHEIGDLALDLGRKIVQEYDDNAANFERHKDQATHLTSLLVFRVYPALSGQDGVSESGLLRSTHPGLAGSAPAKAFLNKLDARVKDVARESYELLRAGGTAQKTRRDDLNARINDLKTLLSQSSPKDRHLLPGGPEFPPMASQIAGAGRR